MSVIDISDRIFTKEDKDELCSLLRKLSRCSETDNVSNIRARADFLMRKAGAPKKFFKNESKLLKEIL